MHASALFSFLTLALVAFAEPIRIRDSQISFPVAKRVNSTVGAAGLALRDKQRAKFLKQSGGSLRQASSVGSIPSSHSNVYHDHIDNVYFELALLSESRNPILDHPMTTGILSTPFDR